MLTQDTTQLKEKIILFIKIKGPILPVHIAKEINTSMLFASVFLSELLSEKKLKISNTKVGNSPLYFIPGQENQLERFSHHLKSKEKEAFELLKEKKIIKNSEQEPAIKVALTEIKDFAIPFSKNNELYWKYLTVSEEDKNEKMQEKTIPLIKEIKKQFEEEEIKEKKTFEKIIPSPTKEKGKKLQETELNIFDKSKTKIKKPIKKKTSQKKNDKFFNKVKEFLTKKSIEILDIENFSKNDLILRIKINNQEKLLIAYNKKRINQEDIIKSYKKASELNLRYIILSLGDPLKKLNNFIEAIQNLDTIEKIEE